MKKTYLAILSTILFFSCNKQPSCADPEIKELVYEIVKEEYWKEVKEEYIFENYNYQDVRAYSRDNGLAFEEVDEKIRQDLNSEAEYQADISTSEARVALNGIRIIKVDEAIKQCECAAELILNAEEPYDVQYTAQYTEDDQIYVELYY